MYKRQAIVTTQAAFDPLAIDVSLNGIMVCKDAGVGADRELCDLSGQKILIEIDLKAGKEEATIWTNDLSAMYVHENSSYSS